MDIQTRGETDFFLCDQAAIPHTERRVDALALCTGNSLAWFNVLTQRITYVACTPGAQLQPICAFHDVDRGDEKGPVDFVDWKMAANAPVVVAVLEDGAICVVRAELAGEPRETFSLPSGARGLEVCNVSPCGFTAVIACAESMVVVNLHTHREISWFKNTTNVICADVDENDNIASLIAAKTGFLLRVNDAEENVVAAYPDTVPYYVEFTASGATERHLYVYVSLYKTQTKSTEIKCYEYTTTTKKLKYKHALQFSHYNDNFSLASGHHVSLSEDNARYVIFSKITGARPYGESVVRPVALVRRRALVAYMPDARCIRVALITQ